MARTDRKLAVAALALTSLSACAPNISTHGYRFDEASLAQLEPGRTTEAGVTKLLGSPSSVATFDKRIWYYITQRWEQRSFYQDKVVEQKVVTLTFNDKGVLQNIDRYGLGDARQVALVDRVTPTSGNELTLLQQFLGNIGRFNPAPGQGSTPTGSPTGGPGGIPGGG
jgi:outer membrane protein assembly factor BamE (lipoprotein component of BamABCDE complex)